MGFRSPHGKGQFWWGIYGAGSKIQLQEDGHSWLCAACKHVSRCWCWQSGRLVAFLLLITLAIWPWMPHVPLSIVTVIHPRRSNPWCTFCQTTLACLAYAVRYSPACVGQKICESFLWSYMIFVRMWKNSLFAVLLNGHSCKHYVELLEWDLQDV